MAHHRPASDDTEWSTHPLLSSTISVDNFVKNEAEMAREAAEIGPCHGLVTNWAVNNRLKSMTCYGKSAFAGLRRIADALPGFCGVVRSRRWPAGRMESDVRA